MLKKNPINLLEAWEQLFEQTTPCFHQYRVWRRARELALSALACLGRRTVTGMLATNGRIHSDWTAAYRLFSRKRFDADEMFGVVRRAVTELWSDKEQPLVVALDDSLLRRGGNKTHGVAWRWDPLGPKFQVNLVKAQRVVQISAAVPEHSPPATVRMVPIDFCHAPTPKKPGPKASEAERQAHAKLAKEANISLVGVQRLIALRRAMDQDGHHQRPLWAVVDGRYTNRTVLQNLPDRCLLIGRIRKDTRLYYPPEKQLGRGRKRSYGELAPTPEQLRQDQSIPWQSVRAHAAGKIHNFKVKSLDLVLWRAAGTQCPLRVIAIAPLAYRLSKGQKLLYRKPAYLLCTDPAIPIEQVVQAYVWRWEIEVNFRDEKTLIGVGEAQVRTTESVEAVPQLLVAAYAMLLTAAERIYRLEEGAFTIALPIWRRAKPPRRLTTKWLLADLRKDLWARAIIGMHFSGFTHRPPDTQGVEKTYPQAASSILYAA